jgi:hypothetical protein
VGRIYFGMAAGQRVREEWSIPSYASTLRMAILTVLDGEFVKLREWVAEGVGCECFNRFIPEVGGDGFQCPPFECYISVSRGGSALLWRPCQRLDIEGKFPAMWPLMMNYPHIWTFRVSFQGRRRVL